MAQPDAALDSLPRHLRLPVALRAAGLTNREIALELNSTEGTVRVYMTRAAQRLGLRQKDLFIAWHETRRRDSLRVTRELVKGWLTEYGRELPHAARRSLEGIIEQLLVDCPT